MRCLFTTLAVAALAMVGTAACDPLPPASFLVNSVAEAGDAHPGDGLCEVTSGDGQCTLLAAVEEGNALGRADIVLPDTDQDVTYPLGPVTVTGRLTITGPALRPDGPTSAISLASLHVAPEGALTLDRIGAWRSPGAADAAVTADGALVVRRAALFVPVVVTEAGQATLLQAALAPTEPAVALTVRGTATVLYTTMLGADAYPAIDVGPAAQVAIGASQIRHWGTDACAGPALTSLGHNVSAGSSCGLAGPGDVVSDPFSDEAAVDLVPAGVLGCGTDITADAYGRVRPHDGDGNGIAACDAGPVETTPTDRSS